VTFVASAQEKIHLFVAREKFYWFDFPGTQHLFLVLYVRSLRERLIWFAVTSRLIWWNRWPMKFLSWSTKRTCTSLNSPCSLRHWWSSIRLPAASKAFWMEYCRMFTLSWNRHCCKVWLSLVFVLCNKNDLSILFQKECKFSIISLAICSRQTILSGSAEVITSNNKNELWN